jgi:Helix-turn-helix domain/Domain of unknown function (DUF4115)
VTLLPPLKRIRTLSLAQFPKLPLFDPRTKPTIENATISSEPIPVVETPREILLQIGMGLRQWREYYGLSIDELSASTQIQPRLIQAIEEGHIEMLPEPVYVRGMVKRYGDRIGLNGTAIAQNVPTWQREEADFTSQTATRTATAFHPPRRIPPGYLYLGYILAIVGIGAVSSHLINDAFKPKSAILPPPVSISQPAAIPIGSAVPSGSQLVKIAITVKNPAWAQIGIDGTTKFTGNLKVGMQFNWVGEKQITISTNNAGALLLSRDGQPAQPVGKIGEKQQVTIKIK